MGEPRFPPPRGEEPIGYRDAVAPPSDDKPEPPVPSSTSFVVQRRRVVASRPDDFDVALAKAFTPPRRTPRQQASRAGVVILVFILVIWFGLQLAARFTPHARRAPATTAQP